MLMVKKNGRFKNWYKNQRLKSEGYYKNNLMNDDWKFYYKSGNIMVRVRLSMGMEKIRIK